METSEIRSILSEIHSMLKAIGRVVSSFRNLDKVLYDPIGGAYDFRLPVKGKAHRISNGYKSCVLTVVSELSISCYSWICEGLYLNT